VSAAAARGSSFPAKEVDKGPASDYVPSMTATLRESQADLQRLVEMASRGEEVVITVDGKPKAKLTAVGAAFPANASDVLAWAQKLEELRRKYATGKTGLTAEQIVAEGRAEQP